MKIAFVNGTFCKATDAKISIFDRGFLFGDAIYEVLPVYKGHAFFVDKHLARLNSNLEKVKIKMPSYDWDSLIQQLILENGSGDMQVYIHITRGDQGQRKHDIPQGLAPTVVMFTIHNSYPNLNEKENGLKAKIVEDIRWKRCDIKTTSLIANILLNDEALSSGYQTAILVRDGLILEGSASNIFIVTKNGLIKTPPLSQLLCLPGITRQVTLELVNALNWECLEGDIEVSELFDAQEIWLTSTTKEIFPIIQIDESLINKGTVGNYWRAINQSYLNLIKIKK